MVLLSHKGQSVNKSVRQFTAQSAGHWVNLPIAPSYTDTKPVTGQLAAEQVSEPGNEPADQKHAWMTVQPMIWQSLHPLNRSTSIYNNLCLSQFKLDLINIFSEANITANMCPEVVRAKCRSERTQVGPESRSLRIKIRVFCPIGLHIQGIYWGRFVQA